MQRGYNSDGNVVEVSTQNGNSDDYTGLAILLAEDVVINREIVP